MRDWLHRTLVEMVPRDHRQSARELRRRQIVTAVFAVVRRRGARVLAEHRAGQRPVLPRHRGARRGVGRRCLRLRTPAPGPDHAPRRSAPPRAPPILLGLALAGVFVVGGLVVRQVPALEEQVSRVLDHADQGVTPLLVLITAVNGVAEELFFRGAAYAATTALPGAGHDRAYTAVTLRDRQRDARVRGAHPRAGRRPAAPRIRRHPGADPHARHVVAVDAVRAAGDLLGALEDAAALVERAAYGLLVVERLARHDVADAGVGDEHLGAHRVDQVAAGGHVDVGDQGQPVRREAGRQHRDP